MDASTIGARKVDGWRPLAEPVIWVGREVVDMTLDGELVSVLTEVPIDAVVEVVEVVEDEAVVDETVVDEAVEDETVKDETVEEAVLEEVVVARVVVTITVVLVLVPVTVVVVIKWTGGVAVLRLQYWTYGANLGSR